MGHIDLNDEYLKKQWNNYTSYEIPNDEFFSKRRHFDFPKNYTKK
jgi:hypothetical protein